MNTRLNTKSAFVVVLFELVFSVVAGVIAAIFFGGVKTSQEGAVIDKVLGSSMAASILVMCVLLFISFVVFKDSRRDIFFERQRFSLAKWYYLFPLAWVGVSLFVLAQVQFAAYAPVVILQVIIAALAIAVNEEIVTRGILLVGLRNSRVAEWRAWLVTLLVFSLSHAVNLVGGASPTILLVTLTGGTLLYVGRRVFNNLFVPIGMHALYDIAFLLFTGLYAADQSLPDHVLDVQLGSFLVLLLVTILFLIFGRGLFKQETVGWE